MAVAIATAIVVHERRATAGHRSAIRCRDVIAANFRIVVRDGLRALDACHAKRDAGRLHQDCNQLFSLSPPPPKFADLLVAFSIETARTAGIIKANCSAGPVLDNYPNATAAADIPNVVGNAVRKEMELSGASVQGAPALAGQLKGRRHCHAAIGRARTAIVLDTIRTAVRCQRGLDPSVGELGAIAADCLGHTTGATSRAQARLARACVGIGGLEVGSCASLPDCVVADAVRVGETIARDFYGATPAQRRTLCGNGFLDLGEDCDDGNADPTDACTNTCQNARCGDGIVHAGVEECDDGNHVNDDACSNKCTRTSCGDGIVQAGEECDDGNDVPNDGCTDCTLDPVPCNADGLDARVCLGKTQETEQDIVGIEVEIAYPAPLSIPGSGLGPTVRQRVTDLTGAGGLSAVADQDRNADGVDETLRNAYAMNPTTPPTPLPLGPFELIHFDCPAGTLVRAHDLQCAIPHGSDPLGGSIDSARLPLCLVGIAPHGGTPNVPCPAQ